MFSTEVFNRFPVLALPAKVHSPCCYLLCSECWYQTIRILEQYRESHLPSSIGFTIQPRLIADLALHFFRLIGVQDLYAQVRSESTAQRRNRFPSLALGEISLNLGIRYCRFDLPLAYFFCPPDSIS